MAIDINNINSGRPEGLKRQDGLDKRQAQADKSAESTDKATAQPKSTTASAEASSVKDSVSISSTAQSLTQIENELKASPEVDKSKVEEIRARIENGDYNVNPQNLAQKMLDFDL